jgi:hypothetical protein
MINNDSKKGRDLRPTLIVVRSRPIVAVRPDIVHIRTVAVARSRQEHSDNAIKQPLIEYITAHRYIDFELLRCIYPLQGGLLILSDTLMQNLSFAVLWQEQVHALCIILVCICALLTDRNFSPCPPQCKRIREKIANGL